MTGVRFNNPKATIELFADIGAEMATKMVKEWTSEVLGSDAVTADAFGILAELRDVVRVHQSQPGVPLVLEDVDGLRERTAALFKAEGSRDQRDQTLEGLAVLFTVLRYFTEEEWGCNDE